MKEMPTRDLHKRPLIVEIAMRHTHSKSVLTRQNISETRPQSLMMYIFTKNTLKTH